MKKRYGFITLAIMAFGFSVGAQHLLYDPFIVVSGASNPTNGEYLVANSLTNSVNRGVYGGPIIGYNTNAMWTGSTDLFKPQSSGLSYTGGDKIFVSSGGSLELDLSAVGDGTRSVTRKIYNGPALMSHYFSALMKATADADGTAVIRFDDVDGLSPSHSPYMWGVGFGFMNGNIVLITRSGGNSRVTHTVMSDYVAGETYLIVVSIDVDTNIGGQYNDTVSVWVNPALLSSRLAAGAPTFKTEINTLSNSGALLVDEVGFYTSGFGGGTLSVDEIRMGRQWYDAVPWTVASDMILYDDFRVDGGYIAGAELNGQNVYCPGFAAPWGLATSSYWKPYSENLTYTNRTAVLISSGGSIQVNMPNSYDRLIIRATTNITVDSVLYISSLMNFTADGEVNDFAYAQLYDSDDGEQAGVQWGLFEGEIGIRCRVDSGNNRFRYALGDGSYRQGETYLFVLKIEKNVVGWQDRVTVYLNPENLRSEAASTADLVTLTGCILDSTKLNRLKVRSTWIDNGRFKVDEIRVGTTWEQVTPYEQVIFGTVFMVQ